MSLVDRAILSRLKPNRAEKQYAKLAWLIECGGKFKRCKGKKPFDRDPGATLDQLADHKDNIAFRPSSLGLGCLDFDAGKHHWFIHLLKKTKIPYTVEKSTRGAHVFFPVARNDGSNFHWQNKHGEGDMIYSKMVVIRDIELLFRLYGKARKSNAKAHRQNVFRHIGAMEAPAPAPAGNPSKDKTNLILQLSKHQKRDDDGYFYGNRNNQLNSDVWYDRLKGSSGWRRRLLALGAHKEEVESIESWMREVDYTYRRTASEADAWKQFCMTAATCVSTTDACQRVLGAMWAIAKTTSTCWASHETIALIADCSIKTVQRAQILLQRLKIIRFKGYHYSGTCMWSFADLGMSDKPFFTPVGEVRDIVRRLHDDVDEGGSGRFVCRIALRRDLAEPEMATTPVALSRTIDQKHSPHFRAPA